MIPFFQLSNGNIHSSYYFMHLPLLAGTLFVSINFLDFSPGPHNFTLTVVDVFGQMDQFMFSFTGSVAPRKYSILSTLEAV